MEIRRTLLSLGLMATLVTGCAPVIGTLEVGLEDPGAGLQATVTTSATVPTSATVATSATRASATSPAGAEVTATAASATAASATAAPATAAPQEGTVSGKVCYPSEFIPAMTAFFQDTASGQVRELAIPENQASFRIHLPPGEYIAFAYLNSGAALGGSYSKAVPCGLTLDCSDHAPLPFEVSPGGATQGIDLCDWYAPEALPPNPQAARGELAGVVYVSAEGEYFNIQPDGGAGPLFSGPGMIVPWVGPRGVYLAEKDLMAIDLFTGEQYNLTKTPDMLETSFQFEVGLPEQVLFTALPTGQEAGPGITGGLYVINIDGSGLRTIDAEANAGVAAASPNGQEIAYGAGETGFIFNWERGRQVFDPRQYGLDSPKGQNIASPSWSPLGDQLAWFVQGFFNGQETSGYGIFDLNARTFRLLHPHTVPGMDGFPPAARWSPDGEWLALWVYDADPARSGVWLVNIADPQQEIFMGAGSGNPVFGPWGAERKVLAYSRYDEAEGASYTWLYEMASNEHRRAPLPANSQVVKWW